jgi:tetratricopeptide (TPR) repeat protein
MDELSRQIGRAEAEFEKDPDNIEFGLKLAKLYLSQPDSVFKFNEIASGLLEKHSGDIRLQELLYQVAKASNNKQQADIAVKSILAINPKNIEELRRKLGVLRDLDDKKTAIETILEFETRSRRSPETIWVLVDTYLANNEPEKASKIFAELEAMPDGYMKYVVQASTLISTSEEAKLHKNWEKSQDLILAAIKLEPQNMLAYRVFIMATKNLAPNRKTLDSFLDTALENKIDDAFVYLNLLGVYIEYSIVIRTKKLFQKLRVLLPEYEHSVLSILEVLTQYFDNYGLARSIIGAWFDPNESGKPEFSIFIANYASNLAHDAQKGIGIKASSIDENKEGKLSNEELAKFLNSTAIDAIQRYMKTSGESPDAYYRLGMLYKAIGDDRAYISFDKALQMQPENVQAMYQIAIIKDNVDDDIEAYEMFRRIAQSKSTEMSMMIDAMVRASEIAIKYGWIDEGEEFLEKANALMPTNPHVVTLLGKVFLKEAKIIGSDFALAKAQENFIHALVLDPMNTEASYYLGQVYYMKREYLAAIRQFSETSQKFKTCSMLCSFWTSRSYHQLFKGLLFSSKDFLTSAIKHAESLRTLAEKIPETQEYIAELYKEAGKKGEADRLMEKAKQLKKIKEFEPVEGCVGEVKVLAVYAPQISRVDDPNRVERVFSKGSVGKIEVSYIPGNGGLIVTGNMGESFQNAIEVAYAFFKRYLMEKNRIQDPQFDIHVDIPGWLPKFDGPSAGVNLACAMVSAYTGKPIPENITMTGEISFHGNVMPVGGIKEKIEATYDKGVDKIFIPKENQWDYLDMLIKDTMQEMITSAEKTSGKLPIVRAVDKIEEVIDDLGIGAEFLVVEEPEEEKKPKKKDKK